MARRSKAPTYNEVVKAASIIRNDKFRELVDAAIVRELDGRKLNTVGWCFDGPTTIKVFTLNGTALTYLYIDLDCVYDADYHKAKIKHSSRLHNLRVKSEQYRQMIIDKQRDIDSYKEAIAGIVSECGQVVQEIEQSRTVKLT